MARLREALDGLTREGGKRCIEPTMQRASPGGRSSQGTVGAPVREERTAIEPKFVRLEIAGQPELVVEVGAVRIRVGRGFDASLLRDLVAALGART